MSYKTLPSFDAPVEIDASLLSDDDEKTYRKDERLNYHKLAKFYRDPKVFREFGDFEEEENDAMRFGTATHIAVLEGLDEYKKRVAAFAPPINPKTKKAFGSTTKEYASKFAEFVARNSGKTIVSKKDDEDVRRIYEETIFHPIASDALNGGWKYAEFPVYGVFKVGRFEIPVKGKIDAYTEKAGLIDFKTTSEFDDYGGRDAFKSAIFRRKYLVQLGFYHKLLTDVLGLPFVPVNIVGAERNAPNRCAVYQFARVVVEKARYVCEQWLSEYAYALESDEYVSKYDKPQIIDYYDETFDIQ